MSDYIYFTKYTSDQNPVTKIFWIENGKIKKELTNSLFKGVAKRIKMKFDDFENALNKATTRQTFGYGLHDRSFPDKVNIVVDGKEIPTDNVLSKTKKFFKYRQLPGILMIDHDPDDYGQQFTAKELISVLLLLKKVLSLTCILTFWVSEKRFHDMWEFL